MVRRSFIPPWPSLDAPVDARVAIPLPRVPGALTHAMATLPLTRPR